ncbi:hypothetical protein [Luteimonas kalidii]|uniref:DUF3619 family protein n=1 Tax=Luteimonas kalidii TaxID=3042025 RepID=A0ABT6JRE6_9GAMM|nr:hypothetical protein [Luteimonas kalidii]MDH5833162.1 hypothetical protein [Luteimonas kalidii]
MTPEDRGHARFDQAMRAAHADAVAHVSAATLAQLHRRRHAALEAAPARSARWRLPAAAFASLLVVAAGLGIGLRPFDDPSAPQAAPPVASTTGPGIEGVLDDLDQDPDFYVWLASGDADLLAME